MASIRNGFIHVETGVHNIFDNPDPCSNNDRNIGIAGGAVAGLLATHFLGKRGGALVAGAAIGALAGGLIGHSMDSRRCALYKIAEKNKLKLLSAAITEQRLGLAPVNGSNAKHAVGLDVQLANKQDEFQPGTATLNPQARVYLGQIASEYTPKALEDSLGANASPAQRQQIANRQVLVVGHTDERDSMPGLDLARLSQERAKAVARVFEQHGVPAGNIFYQGAGDSLPLISNATASGRADNNRVQIVDTPDLHTMTEFLQTREANPADFESAKPTLAATTVIGAAASQTGQTATPSATAQDSAAGSAAQAKPPAPATSFWGRWEHKAQSLTLGSKRPAPQRPLPVAPAPVPAHATAPAVAAVPVTQKAPVLGLVGQPMQAGYRIDLGAPTTHSLFSIIPSAHAAAPVVVGPCWQDHPHGATVVRNLASGEPLSIRNAMPGLYGEPWWSQQNDAAVALLHTYAPRDGGAPVPPTTVEFYSKRPGTAQWHLTAKDLQAPVNIYRGSRFTLYRVFLSKRAQCVDLAVPNATAASHGYVIYKDVGREYGASLQFTPRG